MKSINEIMIDYHKSLIRLSQEQISILSAKPLINKPSDELIKMPLNDIEIQTKIDEYYKKKEDNYNNIINTNDDNNNILLSEASLSDQDDVWDRIRQKQTESIKLLEKAIDSSILLEETTDIKLLEKATNIKLLDEATDNIDTIDINKITIDSLFKLNKDSLIKPISKLDKYTNSEKMEILYSIFKKATDNIDKLQLDNEQNQIRIQEEADRLLLIFLDT